MDYRKRKSPGVAWRWEAIPDPESSGGGTARAGGWKPAAVPSSRASEGTLWGKPVAKFQSRAGRITGNHTKSQARDHGRKVISDCLRNNAYPSAKPSTDSGVRRTVYAISRACPRGVGMKPV